MIFLQLKRVCSHEEVHKRSISPLDTYITPVHNVSQSVQYMSITDSHNSTTDMYSPNGKIHQYNKLSVEQTTRVKCNNT